MKYDTPKQHLRRLRIDSIKVFLNYLLFAVICGLALFILYICFTCGDDTEKMNKCLENHDWEYCNREVK